MSGLGLLVGPLPAPEQPCRQAGACRGSGHSHGGAAGEPGPRSPSSLFIIF